MKLSSFRPDTFVEFSFSGFSVVNSGVLVVTCKAFTPKSKRNQNFFMSLFSWTLYQNDDRLRWCDGEVVFLLADISGTIARKPKLSDLNFVIEDPLRT